jgi:hypothetical protein
MVYSGGCSFTRRLVLGCGRADAFDLPFLPRLSGDGSGRAGRLGTFDEAVVDDVAEALGRGVTSDLHPLRHTSDAGDVDLHDETRKASAAMKYANACGG